MSIHFVAKWLLAFSIITAGISVFAAAPAGKEPNANGVTTADAPADKHQPKTEPATKPRVLVTISKETTYITEPLRKDGYPDYVAALNQRLSKGVTPENNAAVPFWKAMGPGKIKKEHRAKFFEMLGVPPLPEKGPYFITFDNFFEDRASKDSSPTDAQSDNQQEDLSDQLQTRMTRPWSKRDFPRFAQWLEINEKPLSLLSEACQRPRRYEPLISGNDNEGMMTALLPGAQASRECARALTARAMLRISEGKIDDAWNDLLNCHRFARLTGQGGTLIDALVGISIDGMVCAGDRALLQNAKLTPAQIAKMRADLDKLPPMPGMVDKLDLGERFLFLDCVSMAAHEGPSGLAILKLTDGGGASKSLLESLTDSLAALAVDWDVALRMGNSWYDRIAAAARMPTRSERIKATNEVDKDLRQMTQRARDPKYIALSLLGSRRQAISERIGQMFVALLLPAAQPVLVAEDRQTMQSDETRLAYALAAFHADHNSYPPKLAELVPRSVKDLPKDIFNNDADLHYTLQDGGYLLYSVGENGKDDGGRGRDDRKNDEDWDDLAVRISTAKP
jgi:hypothetical protein